jgi:hypothetical protein
MFSRCITYYDLFSGMQIVPHVSFQHTPKAFPVPRQYGQTGNIMVIARCLQTLQLKCGSLSPKLSTFCILQYPYTL